MVAGAELQRTQVAPEADAFTFAQIAGHTGVTTVSENYASADAEDILEDLRTVTSAMDENQVTLGSRILFITPTLKGVLDDFSHANPNRSNRVLERFSRIVERSAVIKFDKHVASRVFSPDELEALGSYVMKYRKYGIVELFDNKLDGVYVSASTE